MEFRLLGTMSVAPSLGATPTAPKPRQVLALLLTHANRPVPTSTLVEELWGERPPATAVRTLQTYVFQLRRRFAEAGHRAGGAVPPRRLIHTGAASYLLRVDEERVDVTEFRRLSRLGRVALAEGRFDQAARLLAGALALWRGPALADIRTGRPLTMQAVRLEEDRLAVLERRIDADLRAGLPYHELIGELSALSVAHPLHEGICHRLMTLLCLARRRSEAITAYHRLRGRLVAEFGMEPSSELRELYQRVICDELAVPPFEATVSPSPLRR